MNIAILFALMSFFMLGIWHTMQYAEHMYMSVVSEYKTVQHAQALQAACLYAAQFFSAHKKNMPEQQIACRIEQYSFSFRYILKNPDDIRVFITLSERGGESIMRQYRIVDYNGKVLCVAMQ